MPKTAHFFVIDGFADWEAAMLLAELRRSGGYDVTTIGFTRHAATSMGGLRVEVDTPLDALSPEGVDLLVVPGGDFWAKGDYPQDAVNRLLATAEARGAVVAAICGATVAAARAGLLDDRAHTSNTPEYLRENAPGYRGADRYEDRLAVRDRRVVTASGLGAVEFAREVFAEVGLFDDETLAAWYETFKHGRYVLPAGE